MLPQSLDRIIKDNIYDIKRVIEVYYKILRCNIEFGAIAVNATTTPTIGVRDNISGVLCAIKTPAVANTEFSFTHNLQRVPTGYLLVYEDKAASVFDSGTAWTVTDIFLKCNIATVKIKIFVF